MGKERSESGHQPVGTSDEAATGDAVSPSSSGTAESSTPATEPDPAQTLAPPPPVLPVDRLASDPAAAAPLAGTLPPPGISLPEPDYNAAGVPGLDYVRDKIEGRYARSLGSTELAEETPEARSVAKQAADREEAARDRLEAIRRSLRGDSTS